MTITPGTNSYVSLDDADAILSQRLFAAPWSAADAAKRAQALITATTLLDRLKWAGRRSDFVQTLAWPRTGIRDQDRRTIPNDEIPLAVKTACAEFALHLLTSGQLPGGPNVQMRQLGDSMTMYYPTTADELPKHVRRLLEPYLSAASAHSAELVP